LDERLLNQQERHKFLETTSVIYFFLLQNFFNFPDCTLLAPPLVYLIMDLNSTITRGKHTHPFFSKHQFLSPEIDDSVTKVETVTQPTSPDVLYHENSASAQPKAQPKAKSQRRASPPFLPSKSLGNASSNPLRRSVIFSLLAHDINANSEVKLNSSAVSDGSAGSIDNSSSHKEINKDDVDMFNSSFAHSLSENNVGGYERRLSDSGNNLSRSIYAMMSESMSSPAAPYLSPQQVPINEKKKRKTLKISTNKPSLSSRLRMLAWERAAGEEGLSGLSDGKSDEDEGIGKAKEENEKDEEEEDEDEEDCLAVKILGLSSDSSDSSGFPGFETETVDAAPMADSSYSPSLSDEHDAVSASVSVVDAPSPMNPTEVRRFASVRDRLHAVNPLRTTSTALINRNCSSSTSCERKPPLPSTISSSLSSTRRPSLTSPGSPPRLNGPKGVSAASVSSTHSEVLGIRNNTVHAPQLAHSSPPLSSENPASGIKNASIVDLARAYDNAFRVSVRSTLARASMDTNVSMSWKKSSSISPERRNSSSSPSSSSSSSSPSSSPSSSSNSTKSRRFSLPTTGSGWNGQATLAAAELVHSVFSPTARTSLFEPPKPATNLSLIAEKVIRENLESVDELKRFIQELASQRGRQAVAKHLSKTSNFVC
jgi:hypothetical protein